MYLSVCQVDAVDPREQPLQHFGCSRLWIERLRECAVKHWYRALGDTFLREFALNRVVKPLRAHSRARREDGVWVIEASGTEPGPHCVDDVDGRQPYNYVEVNQRIAWQRGFTLRHGTDELKVVRVCNAGDEDIDLAPREDALDKRSINRPCSPPDMQLFTPSC